MSIAWRNEPFAGPSRCCWKAARSSIALKPDNVVTDGALLMEDGRIRAVGRRPDVISNNDLAAARRVDARAATSCPASGTATCIWAG